jgi:hypothetical protein
LRLLLDEMYPRALATALRARGIESFTVAEMGLAGQSDWAVMADAVAEGLVVLTENVSDFARIATAHLSTGGHHPGVLVALSSRFSRRPGGINAIAAAVFAIAGEDIDDRVVYLELPSVF